MKTATIELTLDEVFELLAWHDELAASQQADIKCGVIDPDDLDLKDHDSVLEKIEAASRQLRGLTHA